MDWADVCHLGKQAYMEQVAESQNERGGWDPWEWSLHQAPSRRPGAHRPGAHRADGLVG